MSDDGHTPGLAVVYDRSSEGASEMKVYLERRGVAGARWYDPVTVSNLDKAVRDGRIRRVVFHDMAFLFDAIWDEEIVFDTWLRYGVQLEFVKQADVTPESMAEWVYGNWQTWKRRHHRRQTIAGLIISVIALGLCFLINVAVP